MIALKKKHSKQTKNPAVRPVNHSERPLDIYTFEDESKPYQMDQEELVNKLAVAEVDRHQKTLTSASLAPSLLLGRCAGEQNKGRREVGGVGISH